MSRYLKITGLALSAILALGGCGSSDSDSGSDDSSLQESMGAEIDVEKLFFFYNHLTGEQYTYDTTTREVANLNSDETSNLYMSNKGHGHIIYWPHQTTDENGTAIIDEKAVMVNESYEYGVDGNLTHENLIYLGHFHGEDLAAHSSAEFDPDSNISATYSEAIKVKKANALKALNIYLAEQNEIKEEIAEALDSEGETLCNFFVPHHEHEDNETEEETIPHYALTEDGELYIFTEGENGLEKYQGPLVLDGATSCSKNESGMTSAGESSIFVYMHSSKRVYLMDSHGADYHEHSKWEIGEILPSSVEPMQMIGFGGIDEDHEH
jgi:hypothetical protein